jgi:glycosyltransferase involved in cell wall biosynthesis
MRIAMIGLKALPPAYSGFETAADEIARRLVSLGHEVTVYNRAGLSTYEGNVYEGVRLVTLPTINSKNLSSITHAFLCTLHVLFDRVDVVHYFTTGTTLFAPLPRLAGMKTVCSVDGTDWQRRKWGVLARLYLRISERLAVLFCHNLIGDSRDVVRYYQNEYGVEPVLSTYGIRERTTVGKGKGWLQRFGLKKRDYVLFVGRLVPENNVHVLISAYERIASEKKLVIVGDDPWGRRYIRSLKGTHDQRIIFTGGIYGEGYEELQQNAYLFVLPDEVGGTHPSLVEAMGFGNCVLVNDTPSNLEVVADAGFSYRGSEGDRDLERQLRKLLSDPAVVVEYRKKARKHAMQTFRWDYVVLEHERVYKRLLGVHINTETEAASSLSNTAD